MRAWWLLVVLAGCGRRELSSALAASSSTEPAGRVVATSAPSLVGAPRAVAAAGASFDAARAAREVCDNAPGSAIRRAALDGFARYPLGSRAFSLAAARVDRAACVEALLPSAIVVDLTTGVPTGVSIGMSIQETGGCGGKLVEANNFHGQKANLAASGFTRWRGDRVEIESSESHDARGGLVKSAFMRFGHVDDSFTSLAERLVHPDVRGHRYEPCLSLRARPAAFARCIGRIWSVHDDYAERVLRHRAAWHLERCELAPDELRLRPAFRREP
jgi:flagellum-specific peptidoglycan hydrolase FlgJ